MNALVSLRVHAAWLRWFMYLAVAPILVALAGPVAATPPSPLPDHPLALSLGLEATQSQPVFDEPMPAWLEFVRPPGTLKLHLELRTIDATASIDPGANTVPLTYLRSTSAGEVFELDVSGLPEGGKSRVDFTLKLEGAYGAGIAVRLWDVAAATPAEAFLNFAVDELGTVTQVEHASQIGQDQLKRFVAADAWARAQVETSTTIEWQAPADDPDPYRLSDPSIRTLVRWPKGTGATRNSSKKLHRLWDKGTSRNTGVRFAGRLLFRDEAGCPSPSHAHDIPWAACHALKRRVDASFAPVVANTPVAPAFRPLPATLILEYEAWRDGTLDKVCDMTAFETTLDGRFQVELQPCNAEPGGTLEYRLRATVILQALMVGDPTDPAAELGYMRALWPVAGMERLFPPSPSGAVVRWLAVRGIVGDPSTLFSVPAMRFTRVLPGPETVGGMVQLGAEILAENDSDSFNYLRQVLSAWATMVTLHERLQNHFDPATYLEMFRNPGFGGRAFRRSYLVYLNASWGSGGAGRLRLLEPRTPVASWILSDTHVLGHEFGHSVHDALAGSSLVYDHDFADLMMLPAATTRPEGRIYNWLHGVGQFQEMGSSLVEGIASSIGQYLMTECRNAIPSMRTIGTPTPNFANNMWSGGGMDDVNPNGAPMHHARWFLLNRAMIAESSPTFATRLSTLQSLTAAASTAGHSVVKSNDEGRYGAFGCDLLDADTDISYAASLAPSAYVTDFTHDVWKVMTGADTSGQPSRVEMWTGPSGPENVQITLPALVDALANFCPTCGDSVPAAEYGARRLSTASSRQSPQALARYLAGTGVVSMNDLRNVLRANFMENAGFE